MPSPAPALTRRHFIGLAGAAALAGPFRAFGQKEAPDVAARVWSRIRPPEFPAREFRVTDFGAKPDGGSDARPGFLQAIQQCNQSGGGQVIVPAGQWELAGPLHLKSNVHLRLDDRAHLRFQTDKPELYLPVVLTRWEGTECFNYSPLIYAYQAANVAITGGGLIDGNAHDTIVTWRPRQAEDQQALRKMGADGVPVVNRVFGAGHWLRPPFVQFFGCQNVLVDGPRLIDSPMWVIHAIASNNVTIRRVHVDSPHINSDGFDAESSSDVLVEDCVFRTGDDAVVLKSGRDQDAWRIGRPTENVIVRRCEIHAPTAGSGFAIGSEISGGIRNVHVEGLRMGQTQAAINIKANLDRGGGAEQIVIRDVTVEQARTLIQVTTDYQGYRGGNFPPVFKGIRFENIRCNSADVPLFATGVPKSRLEDFVIRDLDVKQATKPAVIRHVRNFRVEHVSFNGQPFESARDAD